MFTLLLINVQAYLLCKKDSGSRPSRLPLDTYQLITQETKRESSDGNESQRLIKRISEKGHGAEKRREVSTHCPSNMSKEPVDVTQ